MKEIAFITNLKNKNESRINSNIKNPIIKNKGFSYIFAQSDMRNNLIYVKMHNSISFRLKIQYLKSSKIQ